MKHEWRKHERELHGAKEEPQRVNVPKQKFITIQGTGNPNQDVFSEKVGALYSLAYPLKMHYKSLNKRDYVVLSFGRHMEYF